MRASPIGTALYGPPLASEPGGQPYMRWDKTTLVRHLTGHRYDRQIDAWGSELDV